MAFRDMVSGKFRQARSRRGRQRNKEGAGWSYSWTGPTSVTVKDRIVSQTGGPFPTKVLLISDGSPEPSLAAQAAADVCTATGSELHAVHVSGNARSQASGSGSHTGDHSDELQAPKRPLRRSEEPEPGGVAGVWMPGENERPTEGIARLALSLEVGLLVTGGGRHRAGRRLFSPDLLEELARLSPCPVLIVRASRTAAKEPWPPREIVVGVDLSEESARVAAFSAALASALGATLSMVFAYYRFPEAMQPQGLTALDPDEETKWYAWRRLDRISRRLSATLGYHPHFRILPGEEASAIYRAAEEAEQPALVAVGTRRLSRVRRALLGSVSSAVLRSADGPILVVPPSNI